MRMTRWFTEHPASVGESYLEHLRVASGFAGRMLLGGLACLAHAVFPFLCARTGSDCVAELHRRMMARRGSAPDFAALQRPGMGGDRGFIDIGPPARS